MGRQPSSGYCQTCRRRRVKCDKEMPECRRCRASGHRCGGYDLPLRMHVMGIQWAHDGTQRMAPVKLVPAKPASGLPLTSFRDDMAAAYFFQTFSWAPFWRSHLQSAISSPTALSGPQVRSLNKACFQAITYTHMGLQHGDAALQIEGRQIYSRAITGMQRMLAKPFPKAQLAWLGETIILMGMYEFAVNRATGTGPEPPHHTGIAHILQRCGPETFQDGPLLDLFRGCRSLLICQGICRRAMCFIEEEPWKTIPWAHSPKNFEDRLMDILVDLPGIAEGLNLSTPRRGDDRSPACRAKIMTHLTTLRQWRRDWNAANSHKIKTVPAKGGDAMLPMLLEFTSSAQAVEILLYNEALLFLTKLGAIAHGEPSSSFASRMADETRGERLSFVSSRDVEPRIQPAVESLMALSSAMRLLNISDEKRPVVTPGPLAAVYMTLMGEPEMVGKWGPVMARYSMFDDVDIICPSPWSLIFALAES